MEPGIGTGRERANVVCLSRPRLRGATLPTTARNPMDPSVAAVLIAIGGALGGAIGGAILAGLFSLKKSEKDAAAQLQSQSDQRNFQARKEAYFAAGEAMANIQVLLIKQCAINDPTDKSILDKISEEAVKIVPAHIFGSNATIANLYRLQTSISKTTSVIVAYNFEEQRSRNEKDVQKANTFRKNQIERVLNDVLVLSQIMVEANIIIRQELGLELDAGAYRTVTNDFWTGITRRSARLLHAAYSGTLYEIIDDPDFK